MIFVDALGGTLGTTRAAMAADLHFFAPDPDFLLSGCGRENHIGTRAERKGGIRPRAGEAGG